MKNLHLILLAETMGQRILKRDIGALTFNGSALTINNRKQPTKQLQCIGGDACNIGFNPELLKCQNLGWDGLDSQWLCSGELDDAVRLGETKVNCEGYNYDKDPKVLIGSCYLSYNLHKTSKYQASPIETVKNFASSILNSELYLNSMVKKALGNGDEEHELESIEDKSDDKQPQDDRYPQNVYEFLVMATDLFDTLTAKVLHLIIELSQIYLVLIQTLLSGVVMITVVFGSAVMMVMTSYFLACSVLNSIFASEGLFAKMLPMVFSPKVTESECSNETLCEKDLGASLKIGHPSLDKTANDLRIKKKARSMLKEFRLSSQSITENELEKTVSEDRGNSEPILIGNVKPADNTDAQPSKKKSANSKNGSPSDLISKEKEVSKGIAILKDQMSDTICNESYLESTISTDILDEDSKDLTLVVSVENNHGIGSEVSLNSTSIFPKNRTIEAKNQTFMRNLSLISNCNRRERELAFRQSSN